MLRNVLWLLVYTGAVYGFVTVAGIDRWQEVVLLISVNTVGTLWSGHNDRARAKLRGE